MSKINFMISMVGGKGVQAYRTYFEKRKIKENETLTWANTATSDRLKAIGIKGDLCSINPREVLARKKWYVEKR